jgi:hypothetical protein
MSGRCFSIEFICGRGSAGRSSQTAMLWILGILYRFIRWRGLMNSDKALRNQAQKAR